MEPVVFAVLLTEGLYHSQRSQHLLDDRQRRCLQLLYLPPLPPELLAEHLSQKKQHGRDQQCDCGQLPVHERRNVDHSNQGERGGYERRKSIDHDPLDCRRIVLDPIDRVGGAFFVVVDDGDALRVIEQLGAERQRQFFSDNGLQQPGAELLDAGQQRDQHHHHHHHQQQSDIRSRDRIRRHGDEKSRQRLVADHAVDGQHQRQRGQQGQRSGQHTERKYPGQMRPERARFVDQTLQQGWISSL